jgi:hypothetical protein
MNTLRLIPVTILLLAISAGPARAQQMTRLGDNAALRYWSAFAQMQDSPMTGEEAKTLNGILAGPVPYDDSKYKELVEKNRAAINTMARGTVFPNCDWGVDYQLGPDTPVDYVRRALELGRLNVLYAFHLEIIGNRDGAVSALATGLRFSHDVANGGSLFAALAARDLLATHFRAVEFVQHTTDLSAPQRAILQKAIRQLGPAGVDWQSATRRDLVSLRGRFSQDSKASAALSRIMPAYIGSLNDPSAMPALQQLIANAPQQLSELIPNPKRVVEEKQDLAEKLSQIRALLH